MYLRLTDAITAKHLYGLLLFWLREIAPHGASVDCQAPVPHRHLGGYENEMEWWEATWTEASAPAPSIQRQGHCLRCGHPKSRETVCLGVLLVEPGFVPRSPGVSASAVEAGFGEFQPLGYPVVGLGNDSSATHKHCG